MFKAIGHHSISWKEEKKFISISDGFSWISGYNYRPPIETRIFKFSWWMTTGEWMPLGKAMFWKKRIKTLKAGRFLRVRRFPSSRKEIIFNFSK